MNGKQIEQGGQIIQAGGFSQVLHALFFVFWNAQTVLVCRSQIV